MRFGLLVKKTQKTCSIFLGEHKKGGGRKTTAGVVTRIRMIKMARMAHFRSRDNQSHGENRIQNGAPSPSNIVSFQEKRVSKVVEHLAWRGFY